MLSTETAPTMAIVTTVADAVDHIEFFIQYHLSLGVSHIIVFIDDCCPSTYDIASRYAGVTALLANEELREHWKSIPLHRNLEKRALCDTEVMIRQEYNVYLGFSLAKSIGIDWVLHIDIDELFFLNGNDLHRHLHEMQRAGVGGCIYKNYEAIPTQQESDGIFTATPFFKKNFFKKGQWSFSDEQAKFIKNANWLSKLFFNYYQNGKCAVFTHGNLVVNDVHSMWASGGQLRFLTNQDPIILHYPAITFQEFTRKYERLGVFDDNWKGFPRAGKFIDTLHLEARDAYASDKKAFKELFINRILITKPRIEALMEKGMAVEIRDIIDFAKQNKNNSYSKQEQNSVNNLYNHPKLHWINQLEHEAIALNELAAQVEQAKAICFNSLGEARLWLRRHPTLSKIESAGVRKLGQDYVITVHERPIYNFGDPEILAPITDVIIDIVKRQGSLQIVDLPTVFCQNYSGQTEFDIIISQVGVIRKLIGNLQPEQRNLIFTEMPYDMEAYLIGSSVCSLIDSGLSAAIEESMKENSEKPICLYIQGRYPRAAMLNWATAYLPKPGQYSPDRERSLRALVYALGGTVFVKSGSPDREFSNLRNRHPFITQSYAIVHTEQSEPVIVLSKKSAQHEFFAACNITTRDGVINLHRYRLGAGWTNMLTNEVFDSSQMHYLLRGGAFLWLIRPRVETRG